MVVDTSCSVVILGNKRNKETKRKKKREGKSAGWLVSWLMDGLMNYQTAMAKKRYLARVWQDVSMHRRAYFLTVVASFGGVGSIPPGHIYQFDERK